jgi:hypothetical protein
MVSVAVFIHLLFLLRKKNAQKYNKQNNNRKDRYAGQVHIKPVYLSFLLKIESA